MRECLLPMMATFFDNVNSWTWTFYSPKYLVAFGLLTLVVAWLVRFPFSSPSYYIIDCAVCLCHDEISKGKEKATIRKSSCNLSLLLLYPPSLFFRCNPMDARESLEMMRMWTLRLVEATSGNCGWRSSSRSFVMLKHTTSCLSFFFPPCYFYYYFFFSF